MKKILTFAFLLVGYISYGQTKGYFRYDSTQFEKGGGNNELIILNGTRSVTGGVLTNTGNGRTAFVAPSAGAFDWHVTGNTGTTPGTNFIGTTNAQGLMFKVNDTQSGYIDMQNGNTSFGHQSLLSNTTGNDNTASGRNALQLNTEGSYNTASGVGALQSNTTGTFNTASGANALQLNTEGNNNTANGLEALNSNTAGNSNTASGVAALYSNTTGSSNTANGLGALQSNTTGDNNTASGLASLYSNTIGYSNTASGRNALYSNTTGNYNTASGHQALYSNNSGEANTASGTSALFSNTTGGSNTASGNLALFSNTTGSSNTASGTSALFSNTTGSNNTAIGFNANVTSGALTNATSIGYNAIVGASNSLVLGGTGADAVKVGIGTTTPLTKLNVVETLTTSPRGILSSQFSSSTDGARVGFAKARGTAASPTTVVTGDILGRLMFRGYDGANALEMGSIETGVSGTVASTRVPTYMAFSTATNAAPSVLTERVRILNDGNVGIGTTSPSSKLHVYDAPASGNNTVLANIESNAGNSNGSTILKVTNGPNSGQVEQNSGGGGFRYGTYVDMNILNDYTGGGPYGNMNFLTGGVIRMMLGGGSQSGTVGIGTTTPAASALLDITSTTKGLLIPRMTTAQQNAISSPAAGLQVYNTTTNSLNFYNGTAWGGIGESAYQQSRVTTQFNVTSSTTLANVTGLTATVVAGKTYRFEANLYTTSNSAAGVKAGISGTCTATNVVYNGFAAAPNAAYGQSTSLGTSVGSTEIVTSAAIKINGTITVNAAGTLTVQFAQTTSNAAASSVLVGSTFVVTEIL